MGPGCLPTVATVAGLYALGVSGLLLLLDPLYNDNPGLNLDNPFLYVLSGLPGAASGFCIRWSCTKGRSPSFCNSGPGTTGSPCLADYSGVLGGGSPLRSSNSSAIGSLPMESGPYSG